MFTDDRNYKVPMFYYYIIYIERNILITEMTNRQGYINIRK